MSKKQGATNKEQGGIKTSRNNENNMIYDLIVIGGGPAGMIGAGRAAENGARVLLLEKNSRLGAKLLVTGKGRCNITNAEADLKKFITNYGPKGKFLFSSFSRFNNHDVINFFENYGVVTKVERGERVFPTSDRSDSVLSALAQYMRKNKVGVKLKAEVREIIVKDKRIEKIVLTSGEELSAEKYLIATGGKSYPGTGSTGTAFEWLKKMGHRIIPPRPALAPIIVKENWVKELAGLSLKNVAINVYQNNKKVDSRFGEALFTHNGLSGPI
ncbi:MAG TPA: aminoacetone oxidase family FAD-binding enzyme, partial [Patescibacteria group bacterium]|nr:aminoacetone oxidase family FAD-binding enzyme [Patescibacteria group bacterium]